MSGEPGSQPVNGRAPTVYELAREQERAREERAQLWKAVRELDRGIGEVQTGLTRLTDETREHRRESREDTERLHRAIRRARDPRVEAEQTQEAPSDAVQKVYQAVGAWGLFKWLVGISGTVAALVLGALRLLGG